LSSADSPFREDVSTQVWFEFIDGTKSATPVEWGDVQKRPGSMVYRPGSVPGWTPVDEVPPGAGEDGPRVAPLGQDSGESSGPDNVQRGISVRYDPVTGGLSGLPESWAGMLPDGCTPDVVGDGELPVRRDRAALRACARSPTDARARAAQANLRPGARPTPGLQLTDEKIIGLPYNVQKWRPSFGVPLEHTQTVAVHGFAIPHVLERLREALIAGEGLSEEGIFRIAPDGAECTRVAEVLNKDPTALPDRTDVHLIANLIKQWCARAPPASQRSSQLAPPDRAFVRARRFRKLPDKLLAAVPLEAVSNCASGATSMQLLSQLPLQHLGVILWLLDLMADVAAMQAAAPPAHHTATRRAACAPSRALTRPTRLAARRRTTRWASARSRSSSRQTCTKCLIRRGRWRRAGRPPLPRAPPSPRHRAARAPDGPRGVAGDDLRPADGQVPARAAPPLRAHAHAPPLALRPRPAAAVAAPRERARAAVVGRVGARGGGGRRDPLKPHERWLIVESAAMVSWAFGRQACRARLLTARTPHGGS
jgi:hypothetical protein